MNNYDLEKALNIDNYSEEDKELILAEVEQVIGERAFANLPEGKEEEFRQITYDNVDHINWWLGENDPDYRETDFFKDAVEVVNEDGNPDNIRPEKVYATIQWINLNVPQYQEITKAVAEEYKGKDWSEYLAERR